MIFLEYIGMVLSAILGILVADYFVVHKKSYDVKQFDVVGGKYWYFKGVNLKTVTVWALGVFFYLGIRNVELFMNTTGAVYPTILVTAILYSLIARRN